MRPVKLILQSRFESYKTDEAGIKELYVAGHLSTVGDINTYISLVMQKRKPINLNIGNVGVLPNQFLVLQKDGVTGECTGCVAFETEGEMRQFFEYDDTSRETSVQ